MRWCFAIKIAAIAPVLFLAVLLGAGAVSLRALAGAGEAVFLGAIEWAEDDAWFYGQSALYVAPGGQSAIVINDRGTRLDVEVAREDGRVTGFDITSRSRLLAENGRALPKDNADSEGLAMMADGRFCVSFESQTRVLCYAHRRAPAMAMPDFSAFAPFPINRGLEALAVDSGGRLYAIPEKSPDAEGYVPVFRLEDGAWNVAMRLSGHQMFRPVSADIVDGQLYLLERAFSLIGFSSRLSRISMADGAVEILLTTGPGRHDNLEGLSLWRDAGGRLIATMISDDNDRWYQRTEVVEYLIPD